MIEQVEIPKYLDVLLILDEKVTRARINRLITRSSNYISDSLDYLQNRGIIKLSTQKKSSRLIIELTDKGKDIQNIIIILYNKMGLVRKPRWG